MDQEKQALFEVDVVNASLGTAQGARRATGEAPSEAGIVLEPEVAALANRPSARKAPSAASTCRMMCCYLQRCLEATYIFHSMAYTTNSRG